MTYGTWTCLEICYQAGMPVQEVYHKLPHTKRTLVRAYMFKKRMRVALYNKYSRKGKRLRDF